MKIERSMHHAISAADVYATSTSREFQERKCRAAGSLSWHVTVEQGETGAIVRIKRTLPIDGFSGMLRKILPAGVGATETYSWGPVVDDGSRTAEFTVEFHNAPASMNGTLRVVPDGANACTVVVDAVFKTRLPLIGAKIEGLAAPIIMSVIDADEASGRAWAAGDRS